MTWTYAGNPASSSREAVRFLVGDTIADDPQLQDEEIDWIISQEGSSVTRSAARAAEALQARYSRQVSKTVGALSLQAETRAQHYAALAQKLWARSNSVLVAPYAGGLSKAEKETQHENDDAVQPDFKRGMQDYGPDQSPTTPDEVLDE